MKREVQKNKSVQLSAVLLDKTQHEIPLNLRNVHFLGSDNWKENTYIWRHKRGVRSRQVTVEVKVIAELLQPIQELVAMSLFVNKCAQIPKLQPIEMPLLPITDIATNYSTD